MSKLRKKIKRCVISQCRRGPLVTYMILYCVWILKKITTFFAAPCITLWRSQGGIKCRPFGSTRNMGGSGASPGKFSCCRLSVSCFGVYLSSFQKSKHPPTCECSRHLISSPGTFHHVLTQLMRFGRCDLYTATL